jgi:hypothetical protein
MGDCPPKPFRQDLNTTAKAFAQLYKEQDPQGDPIPTQIRPFFVPDNIPNEEEIIAVVDRLKKGRATGPSQMSAEHIHTWYKEAYPPTKEDSNSSSLHDSTEPFRENWDTLVHITQRMFESGNILTR